jgi:EAL domain-containing protein (putative c-di-GMP-specific phosphodiesterase class I)
VEILANRIDVAFAHPFILSTVALSITASVGVAFAGPGGDISSHLVNQADTAMYQTKRKGGAGHQTLDIRDPQVSDRANNLAAKRAPVQENQLDIGYLPLVRTADGVIVGVEALLLGDSKQRKPTSGSDAWVLERCCLDRAHWLREHPDAPLDLAVHISARNLARRDFSETVTRVLDRTVMDPAALVLQISENTLGEGPQRLVAALSDLQRLGIRIALDEFGSGYSSLHYLLRLPIQIVKIDRAFITDIGQPSRSRSIVESVTDLAHEFGLTVVAEGVDTKHQLLAVTAAGCDQAQGLVFGQPLLPAEIGAHPIGKR